MPRITEDLVRRRAEHNNCEITTLEELSLHQQEIERIEHLDKWCRNLKILYLQNNLIPKIENVGRLKQLEYLNLALNNIERIENLEGCEFLQKLDLTVNFVGDLFSVESLRNNIHFRQLYLTGNPCTDYEGYREFVIATLPQLQWLDGQEVTKSERILALQKYDQLREKICVQQKAYEAKREREKMEHEVKKAAKEQKAEKKKAPGFDGRWYTHTDSHLQQSKQNGQASEESNEGVGEGGKTSEEQNGKDDRQQGEDEEDERFWNEPTAYTPESRTEVHQYMAEKRKEGAASQDKKGLEPPKRVRRLERDGKMLNVNEGRYDFQLKEDDENNQYILEVAVPRFMDTSLIDCDLQPTYVRLTIKGKILQLVLQEEISPDKSSAQRSQTTGWLQLKLPKMREMVQRSRPQKPFTTSSSSRHTSSELLGGGGSAKTETQEKVSGTVDIRNIVPRETESQTAEQNSGSSSRGLRGPLVKELGEGRAIGERGEGFHKDSEEPVSDDSDVPPLI